MPDQTTPHPGAKQPPPHDPFEDFPPPAPTTALRVVVADDNPVVRAGLTALLSGREDITVVAEAADGRQAYEAALAHHPDVILLDVRMPGVDGLSALPHLVQISPVVMLTYSRESEIVHEALRLGAGGYLVHGEFTADQLVDAVRNIKNGRAHFTPTAADALVARLRQTKEGSATAHNHTPHQPKSPLISAKHLSQLQPVVAQSDKSRFHLSAREAEIMDLIASGMNNQQIAATCFISEKTVKNHINRIFAKLHSTSRAEAAAKWLGVT
ncbi:response regulator transcription factor [Streptomyces sp. NPDC021056]|uniref:response regulator transcription factor n=1 Tax=Streptomyces sp. NPDC021056 TaxID=3155012 RepID=UPI0033E534C1